MQLAIFKNMIIFFTSFYFMDKLNKSSSYFIFNCIKYIFVSLILSLTMYFFKARFPYISYFVPVACFTAFTCFNKKKWSLSTICISLSSYVINLLFFNVVSLVLCSLFVVFSNMSFTHVPGITITICALYPLILMCILKIKPVYQSISALIFNGMVNCNTVICLISLGTMTFEQVSPYHQYTTRRFRAAIIPICLIIILYWWRAQISKNYREKLRLLEIQALRTSKSEDKAYIVSLRKKIRDWVLSFIKIIES